MDSEIVFGGLFDSLETSKFAEKFRRSFIADAGDAREFALEAALVPASAMEGDGEAVGLVADLLYKMQHG